MTKIFISYSHRDEKTLERFHAHLAMLRRDGSVEAWYDREILAGTNIDKEIAQRLTESDIFIALVSPDFLNSNYCYEKEMTKALERDAEGSLRVIPIIAEPCDWTSSPLGKLKALPKDGKAISTWTNQNVAFLGIVEEIRRLLLTQAGQPTPTTPATPQTKKATKQYRIRRQFDAIDRDEFRAEVFTSLQEYFRNSVDELNEIGSLIRARFESLGPTSFTCTVLNKGARDREAHITVHGNDESFGGGGISFSFSRRSPSNTANGFIRIDANEYELFPTLDHFSRMHGREDTPKTINGVSDALWREFISNAGVEHD